MHVDTSSSRSILHIICPSRIPQGSREDRKLRDLRESLADGYLEVGEVALIQGRTRIYAIAEQKLTNFV